MQALIAAQSVDDVVDFRPEATIGQVELLHRGLFFLQELDNAFHDVGQVLVLGAGHVLADVEAEDRLIAGHAVHDPGHLGVDAILAEIEPRDTLDAGDAALQHVGPVRAQVVAAEVQLDVCRGLVAGQTKEQIFEC